ncbi:hypothetical protein FYK55_17565 [Roseiconus nitratireducens]|uniref:Uncharacterized protein n=1 Tax=Roseiconus nitratireducens TaxID=2605748 RepID=A0A5M6D6D4_9BACT|nr:cytochrome c3 family protein [Roseiconus nitratireducens]KAA5541379.1 hypothetical protein FYK55_17565 [Roseiconus nitratireducens]
MRHDDRELPPPPANDRPGDRWVLEQDGRRRLSWTGRRQRLTSACLLFAISGVALMLLVTPATTLFQPGDLSSPHAQILAGASAEQRCGACHQSATTSLTDWFRSGGSGHQGISSSERCMKCHHTTIPLGLAGTAHNLPIAVRDRLTKLAISERGRPAEWRPAVAMVDQNHLRCATCHQEHHGPTTSLTQLSNAQCQACHAAPFGSFAESHPTWDQWPYHRSGNIGFDHRTHHDQHFPRHHPAEAFDCRTCHANVRDHSTAISDLGSEPQRSPSYEVGCASCHEETLRAQVVDGITLLQLPTLPESVADQFGPWPPTAIGFTDGSLSPLVELLIRSDPTIAPLLRQIPNGDLAQLPRGTSRSNHTLGRIATSLRELMDDIADRGHRAIEDRLTRQGLAPPPFRPVLQGLPPQWIEATAKDWFQPVSDTPSPSPHEADQHHADQLPSRSTLANSRPSTEPTTDSSELLPEGSLLLDIGHDSGVDDALLDEGRLSGPADPLDPLAAAPATSAVDKTSVVPSELVNLGGWYRRDTVCDIRYRPAGHADPVLKAMIETFAQLSEGDPLKERFHANPVVQVCMNCHPAADAIPARWTSQRNGETLDRFTVFSHQPHLSVTPPEQHASGQQNSGQCNRCHQIASTEGGNAVGQFAPLGKDNCAACHVRGAAGEQCTTCHRYHIR